MQNKKQGGKTVQLVFRLENWKTNSGKQAISWFCADCHSAGFFNLTGYFYQTILPKNGELKQSLEIFTSAINNNTVSKLFIKPSTAKKLKAELCNCTPGVVDIQYLFSVRRAKEILARGLALTSENETGK